MSCVVFTVRKFTLYFDAHVDDSSTIIILLLEANRYVIGRISERKEIRIALDDESPPFKKDAKFRVRVGHQLLQAVFLCGGGVTHVVDDGEFRVRFLSINVEWVRLAIIYVRLIKVKLISFSGKI